MDCDEIVRCPKLFSPTNLDRRPLQGGEAPCYYCNCIDECTKCGRTYSY